MQTKMDYVKHTREVQLNYGGFFSVVACAHLPMCTFYISVSRKSLPSSVTKYF